MKKLKIVKHINIIESKTVNRKHFYGKQKQINLDCMILPFKLKLINYNRTVFVFRVVTLVLLHYGFIHWNCPLENNLSVTIMICEIKPYSLTQ